MVMRAIWVGTRAIWVGEGPSGLGRGSTWRRRGLSGWEKDHLGRDKGWG